MGEYRAGLSRIYNELRRLIRVLINKKNNNSVLKITRFEMRLMTLVSRSKT
jgi:hypothetical protein